MKGKKKLSMMDVVIHLVMILIAVVILYPMLNVVAISFSGNAAIMGDRVSILPKDFTLENYVYLLQNSKIFRAFGNSLLYTACGVLWNLFMTVLMAYPLSRSKLMGRSVIMKFVIFTLYFSGGTIPLYLVVKGTGLLDTMWSLFVPQSIWTMEMIIMISFFRSLPSSLYEAAELDGAREFTIFARIALPLSKASIASIALFFFMGHWNSYYYPMLYLNDSTKFPLQLVLRSMLLEGSENVVSLTAQTLTPTGVKNAVIVLSMIPVMIVYPIAQKYFVEGVTVGAVKG